MDELREFFSRIKFVRMRTPNLVKIVLIIVIVLCTAVLITLRLSTEDLRTHTEDLRNEAIILDEENKTLDEKIRGLGSIQSVIDIAREKLGLIEPGSVIFETGPAPATQSSEGN